MADSFKRQTAYLCTAKQLLDGEYIKQEGWDPNYIISSVGVLSRVRLAGIVVKQSSPMQFALDDGSATINLRFFDPETVPKVAVGEPMVVIGRPRDLGNERFVVVEIAKKLSSPLKLKDFHKQREELKSYIPKAPDHPPQQQAKVVEQTIDEVKEETPVSQDSDNSESAVQDEQSKTDKPVNKAQILLDAIRELDPGDGAPTEDVLAKLDFPDAEEKLTFLINEGEVFELRAGKVKVLE